MAWADLNSIHNPAPNTIAPATWGDQVRDNFEYLKTSIAEILGSTTLGATADTITVNITAKRFLYIVALLVPSGTIRGRIRFNNDSVGNYAERNSVNGGAEGTGGSVTSILATEAAAQGFFIVAEVSNRSTSEKLVVGHSLSSAAAGAANVPSRLEFAAKWANTATQITRVDLINSEAGDYAAGSQLVVLGHD